jgi:hypothetical protein
MQQRISTDLVLAQGDTAPHSDGAKANVSVESDHYFSGFRNETISIIEP